MQRFLPCCHWGLVFGFIAMVATSTGAGPPSDVLMPRTTVGYISVARPAEFEERWNNTQLGQLLDDPEMEGFVEDLRKQLQDKYRAVDEKLGITWDDLENVPAGELSFSLIERPKKQAALAITVDVTDKDQEVDDLLDAVEQRFAGRGGARTRDEEDGTTLEIFTVPAQRNAASQVTVYFVHDNVLVGIDDRVEASAILKRFAGRPNDNLRSVRAYMATMERCRSEAQRLSPEARWFVNPFGFTFAARTLQTTERPPDEKDTAQILKDTGFDAIHGIGGFANQSLNADVEYLHRVAVYAPPASGKADDPLRWNLSMRMLQLPNGQELEPQPWAPATAANYTSFLLEIEHAFDNLGPVFDAMQGHEEAWANTLEGWETDPYGAQVNVRKELIAHLGERITLITRYDTPITVDSEHALVVVEAKDEAQLAKTLEKWMKSEPDVVRRTVGRFVIWERVAQNAAVKKPKVELPPSFRPKTINPNNGGEMNDEEENRERLLPNSAVCVALGHLFMSSDVDLLLQVLEGFPEDAQLRASPDYQRVAGVMSELAPEARSGWSFGRTEEEFRPTFELIRQGKMPQAKTMLGKFLNNLLTTEVEREDGVVRKQKIDGSRLPEFESVRHYLGPTGRVLHSERDGWFITVGVLTKEPQDAGVANQASERTALTPPTQSEN
jgi:hypothetical protein